MAVVGEVDGSCTAIAGPADDDEPCAALAGGAGEVDANRASRAFSAIALCPVSYYPFLTGRPGR